MEKIITDLDSNSLDSNISNVCRDCWIPASKATWKKKFPDREEPEQYCFTVSTCWKWVCDICWIEKSVTAPRDYFYPDFNLTKQWKLNT